MSTSHSRVRGLLGTLAALALAVGGLAVGPAQNAAAAASTTVAKRVVYGDQIIKTPGTILDNLDIRGRVIVQAADVTIRNSIIRGTSAGSMHSLVDAMAGAPRLKIIDTEIASTVAKPINGVMGSNFSLLRVNIHRVIDQVHIVGSNVTIADSRLHSNFHFLQDPSRGGTPSHDDNVQILGGSNIRITNNVMSNSHNAAVQVTQARALVTGLVISGNRIDHGGCSMNISASGKGAMSVTATNNTVGITMKFKVPPCALIADKSVNVSITGSKLTDGRAIWVTRR